MSFSLAKVAGDDSGSHPRGTVEELIDYDFISINQNKTVGDVLRYLQTIAINDKKHYTIFVVDNNGKLKGKISFEDLVTTDFNEIIKNIMHKEIAFLRLNTKSDEALSLVNKYGYMSLPVVDHTSKLRGVFYKSIKVEKIYSERKCDIKQENVNDSILDSVKMRLPWLILNIVTVVLSCSVIFLFNGVIEKVAILATFLPIVAGLGANSGGQSLSIAIRGLALKELNSKNFIKVLFKEGSLGATTGLATGITVGLIATIWTGNVMIAIILAVAMILNMIAGNISGIVIPYILTKFKLDPASSAAIFLTIITDTLGFLFYLGLAYKFIMYI